VKRDRDLERVGAYAVYRAWRSAIDACEGGSLTVGVLLGIEKDVRQRMADKRSQLPDVERCYNVLIKLPPKGITVAEVARLAEVEVYQTRRAVAEVTKAGYLRQVGTGYKTDYKVIKKLPGTWSQFKEKHRPPKKKA